MQSQSHKVVIPQATLSYHDAPYMRVYIAESVGFIVWDFVWKRRETRAIFSSVSTGA